jgi:hypothetical protein
LIEKQKRNNFMSLQSKRAMYHFVFEQKNRVDETGFEPVTSSMQSPRATTVLHAQTTKSSPDWKGGIDHVITNTRTNIG